MRIILTTKARFSMLLRLRVVSSVAVSLAFVHLAQGSLASQVPVPVPSPAPTAPRGIVVMAHGGSPEWNREVEAAVQTIESQYPVEIAFGMADAASIEAAIRRLEGRGVVEIAVVRLFVSGESWRDRTAQILGLAPGAPAARTAAAPMSHDPTTTHAAAFHRVWSRARIEMSEQGLAESVAMGEVLADRVRSLSRAPELEEVLILAHGPADEAENLRWIGWLEARVEPLRRDRRYAAVRVMTLREDWPERRKEAVEQIRSVVRAAAENGRTTLVIPFRVQGFGPYAEVLDGLPYRADQRGLLPHPAVTAWILAEAERLFGPSTPSAGGLGFPHQGLDPAGDPASPDPSSSVP